MDLTLSAHGWDAVLRPRDGGGMARLRFGGRELLVPAPPGEALGGPFGAFWMIPWANRLDHGRLGRHRLPINRPADATAIHGLSRDRPWQVASAAPDRAAMTQRVAAGPYRYEARLDTQAGAGGFVIALELANRGEAPLPFGAGWHPWFPRPAGTRLAFRASHRCMHDARGLPVSVAASGGLDGGEEAFLGLDTHFAGWDGVARIAWPGAVLTMRAEGDLAADLQIYAPAAPRVLCVEPSSHLPDAANRPELAPLGPMRLLAPGEILTGRLILRLEGSQPAGGAA